MSAATKPTSHAAPRELRAFVPALVAAGTLALGYADLARGGSTISALLLAVGYAALVPWAILRAGMPGTPARPR